MKIIEFLADRLFGAVVWLLCGPTVRSRYAYETPGPRVYYANHSSNLDALVIWAALPSAFRAVTRPVAARDYWDATALRRFLATRLLRAVLIDRRSPGRDEHPVDQMRAVLDAGESLLIFPEGTRDHDEGIGPFKNGLYHLCRDRPATELTPVYLDNLNRVLPKGEVLPVPFICGVTFGAPLSIQPEEPKAAFIARLRTALLELRDAPPRASTAKPVQATGE